VPTDAIERSPEERGVVELGLVHEGRNREQQTGKPTADEHATLTTFEGLPLVGY
jgi:hypothetical protein